MATVCVGCGLDVISGILQVKQGGVGDQNDVGMLCDVNGNLEWVVPMITRRMPSTEKTSIAASGINWAQCTSFDFAAENNTAAGILNIQLDGSIEVLVQGIYMLAITGAVIKRADETDHLIGGRARIYQGSTVIGSDGWAAYDPDVDFSPTTGSPTSPGDGPEWSCSVIKPLEAGQIIEWEVMGQTSAANVTMFLSGLFTIARIGAVRP